MEDELGGLRRTHYSSDLGPDLDGRFVTVMGWVLTVRGHGSITFATIMDKDGKIQVVAKKGACPEDVRDRLSSLKAHSSVAVVGTVRASKKSPRGFEIVPSEVRIFSRVEKTPPFEPVAKTIKNIDTRLEVRPIDLRRSILQHTFKIRSLVLQAVRNYFVREGFTEVNTPKIISSATEGGAALFSIFYYDKQAFLAQSPQLYKEQLTMSFEKVFEIAPIFRAESSRTSRHLSEAISIDLEEAFVDYNDVMDRIESIVKVSADAARNYVDETERSGGGGTDILIPDIPHHIPRYAYGDLIDRLQNESTRTQWGDDLYPSDLRMLNLKGFYFIVDWPLGPKPFYVKEAAGSGSGDNSGSNRGGSRNANDNRLHISESFDLMYGDLELSSGSTRIDRRTEIESRMKIKGMNTDSFEYHLGAFDYGIPPHAGCGIGLERLMMALTGTANIRDATLYPRDVDRLVP